MKKSAVPFFCFLILFLQAAFPQKPVLELSFTAVYNGQHIQLDSIFIHNLTQPGDTMLYAPDTVLSLNYAVGLPENRETNKSSFSVSPNYPNPSMDGKTSIDIFIPEKEHVTIRIADIRGSEVVFYENTLNAGIHHFIYLAGREKYYVLSVTCGNEVRSIKMINAGNNGQMQATLVYNGSSEASVPMKSQNAINGFDFSLGDNLRFTGYSKNLSGIAGSDVMEAQPAGNENYIFNILEGLPCPGLPAVTYEGQTYKTVQIGSQCWFKENLNIGTRIDGAGDQTDNGIIEKYCYNDDLSKCDIYGGLYQWNELMQYTSISGSQGLCPDGWHLPVNDEWTALTTFLGGVEFAGGKMKETGLLHWNDPNTGATNESGFTGLPGGIRMSVGAFSSIGASGTWWSSTEQSSNSVYDRGLSTYGSYVSVGTYIKPMGLSARCVYNDTFLSIPTVNTTEITEIAQTNATGGGEVTNDGGSEVTARGVCWSTSQNPTIADSHTEDGTGTGSFTSILTGLEPGTQYFVKAYALNSIGVAYGSEVSFTSTSSIFTCGDIVTYEGQNYHTIIMGTQCWFLKNLNVGTMVTENQTNNGVVEKYCYNNDPANCEIYGGLYDWGEVMQYSTQPGIQAICPTGWHIPTDEEFTTLTDYISSQPAYFCDNSGFNNAKAIATNTGWDTSSEYCAVGNDQSANNASGFSGMPVGIRMDNGSGFDGAGNTTAWYSSTESSGFAAQGRMIAADYWFILTSMMSKNYGLSVRCLKDGTTTTIPTVTTAAISNISQISAISGGDVTSSGGFPVSARGVCWSTSQNPTIADSHSFNGTGTGPFESILTYLSPNTIYFVRAYATNNLGTAYGDELSFTTLPGNFTCGNIVTYEGQDYTTLQLGTQCWFKENLNVGTMVTETQTNNGIIEKYCLNNNPAKCELYGGLYDWGEAMQYSTQPGIQAICPEGWHIPTDEEFTTFTVYISSQPEFQCNYNPSRNAKAIASTTGWDSTSGNCTVGNNQAANNASGFTGKPAGFRWDTGTGFGGEGYMTEWYSSTELSGYAAKGRLLAADYSYILTSNMSKSYGYSIRCLKN